MKASTISVWSSVHKWTSVICTAFILMLCVTGLPLIFHDEIDAWFSSDEWTPAYPDGAHLTYDQLLQVALNNRPGEVPLYMSFDDDRPVVNVTTGPKPDAPASQMLIATLDKTSGDLVYQHSGGAEILEVILQLHTDMFLGMPGMLFLGAMGVLFLVATVSGVVLYAPFMRKHHFGVVRSRRSKRVLWLDLHNLFGIVTVAWVSVVGFTGVVNTLEKPINDVWKASALADLTAGYSGQGVPDTYSSLDDAITKAAASTKAMQLQFVAFPGGDYSTDHHYAVFFHGNTPLTERIITPALIDARTGEFMGVREMPWYGKGLAISRPLHFGDYGGWPLKALWTLLNIGTIIVLGSGLYLWLKPERRSAESGQTVPR